MANTLLQEIQDHLDAVIAQDSCIWQKGFGIVFYSCIRPILPIFFLILNREQFRTLFLKLPEELQLEVFQEFSDVMKVHSLSFMNEQERVDALNTLPVDELTDLFDLFSDEELKSIFGAAE